MAESFPKEALERLRVLYVSNLVPDYYGEYRLRALRRLGLGHVAAVDSGAFTALSGVAAKLQFRLQAGPDVTHLNHAILQAAERERANVLFCDKVLSLWPATLRKLRQSGVVTVDFVIDNPFGPRRDPGWRLYRR
ncbi:MAG TPA: glycosyltransferase family 1 protein, partial [Acidobacteriaceae bacterium]|nr:glycosyltransferase family 1 protein [Acidobacteriaceae bacterium]